MRNNKIKQFVLLLGLMLPMAWCGASGTNLADFKQKMKQSQYAKDDETLSLGNPCCLRATP